ncbi:PPR domain-containing protein [Cephalotus follicularis]|uniref:PPR domain-containing protein n=1 Tax=Cephalotus follicularis TaxID=3775 RepID=A0A1Q3BGA3_CEPFO|nr:PPR domain-containing protein [Cephalotus follicularis]
MAMRTVLTSLIRNKLQLEARNQWRRLISSTTKSTISKGDLKREILRLRYPRRSATAVIQNWVNEGHKITVPELRYISSQLVKTKRFKHALEISTWMEAQIGIEMSDADHAKKLELIIKVEGLTEAEEYFTSIRSTAAKKAACLALLRGYVKDRDIDKAEALMMRMNGMGLIVSPHPYNEMMKLYVSNSQCEKVLLVISEMKRNKVPLNVLSYNIWMNACGEVNGVGDVEMAYNEMLNDKGVEVGWSTLATLSNVYIKAGFVDKAVLALRIAEKKLSTTNRLAYFFLITMYASLKNKDGVLRAWKASKAVNGRITCANYMSILLCLVKLGDIAEAEMVFMEWETSCRKYDVRVSNILLGAYMRNGLVNKAESLHVHTLERGGQPNYKTWEILMEGWVRSQNMDKAINAMKKGFAMLKHCDWRPSHDVVMAIAEYFEKQENLEEANRYIRDIHRLGLGNLNLYKLLLRMCFCAKRPASDILRMMEKDKIEMDEETSSLVQAFSMLPAEIDGNQGTPF